MGSEFPTISFGAKEKKIKFDLEVTNTRLLALLEPADAPRNRAQSVREGARY
jgi:hypothetical protein